MSDEYLLRDEKGNPLTSVFHKPPIKTWVPKSMREHPKKENQFIMIHSDKYWEDINRELLKLFDLNFTITEFHPNDIEPKEEDKK